MNPVFQLCQWIYATHLSISIRESQYAFPILETIHTLAIALLVGTIAIFDLRLLGLAMKKEPVSSIARQVMPWTWIGFAIMFVTGVLLTISESVPNYSNIAFRIKLILLVLVGLNPLIFHLSIYRKVNSWDVQPITPLRARAAATCSLVLWAGIIVAGRMIAYAH